jgi:positive phototaxis protein PixI
MSNSLSISSFSLPKTDSNASQVTQQFLRFYLMPDTTALLPIHQLTEVLKIPKNQIVPISHMPPWVMGVYNWRGEILWIIDMGHLIGLTPWHQQETNASTYTVIVLQAHSKQTKSTTIKNLMLGLVVSHVEDIEWCNTDLIQLPQSSAATPELVPFLRGYWLNSNGDMLAVMDGSAIMAAMSNH